MKLINRQQIREADKYTIAHEPVASKDLMERAASCFTESLIPKIKKGQKINVFCGKGNNGGDGLAVGRLLHQKGFDARIFILEYSPEASEDFSVNYDRILALKKVPVTHLYSENDFPEIGSEEMIIDALWGTGLDRPIEGFSKEIIRRINSSGALIIAIDIASGTFCDSYNHDPAKIRASHTLSFQLPKLAFLMPENHEYVGEWEILDIGLHEDFINGLDSPYQMTCEADAASLLKTRNAFDHKGMFGHALFIGGSFGKIGAAVLGTKACVKSGAGLVTAFIPRCGYDVMQIAVPEAMVISDHSQECITFVPELSAFNAIAFGPGAGQSKQTELAFRELLVSCKVPLVIDADGINLLASHKELLEIFPAGCILTPHIGEFDRFAGKSSDHFQRIEKALDLALLYQAIIVIKGRYTAIVCPDGSVLFNSSGNPGMATGGSGDVLTGIILSLLAQHYTPKDAAILGVYLHGLAGDLAAESMSAYCVTAGDIIEKLPAAFLQLMSYI